MLAESSVRQIRIQSCTLLLDRQLPVCSSGGCRLYLYSHSSPTQLSRTLPQTRLSRQQADINQRSLTSKQFICDIFSKMMTIALIRVAKPEHFPAIILFKRKQLQRYCVALPKMTSVHIQFDASN